MTRPTIVAASGDMRWEERQICCEVHKIYHRSWNVQASRQGLETQKNRRTRVFHPDTEMLWWVWQLIICACSRLGPTTKDASRTPNDTPSPRRPLPRKSNSRLGCRSSTVRYSGTESTGGISRIFGGEMRPLLCTVVLQGRDAATTVIATMRTISHRHQTSVVIMVRVDGRSDRQAEGTEKFFGINISENFQSEKFELNQAITHKNE
jgi:hypothetical protein